MAQYLINAMKTEKSMEQTMQNMSESVENKTTIKALTDDSTTVTKTQDEQSVSDADDLRILREYLFEKYELRNNVVAGRLEFRERDDATKSFRQLTFEAENTIIIKAMIALDGVEGVKTNTALLLHSEEVPEYDPVREYLTTLPHWDGQNRVAELFGRLPGISSENIYRCTIWMRSAVAHWLRMDQLHGNEVVPTLIGDQGCGKTVFCRRLLPPELQQYFLDRMNFSNKFDKDMALTNNMIVVLDEFDQYTSKQQAALKMALSKCIVNARPIFKGSQVMRHRYASFLATTNNPCPLDDPTGSRRYICIRIPRGMLIDNELPIDYAQLYAQLVEEVCHQGKRFWFTPDEVRQLQIDNVPFQRVLDIDEMLDACFSKPRVGEYGREFTLKQIVDVLQMRYPYLEGSLSLKMRIGSSLKSRHFEQRHHENGNSYVMIEKKAA